MASKVLGFFPARESCSQSTSRVLLSPCTGDWQKIPNCPSLGDYHISDIDMVEIRQTCIYIPSLWAGTQTCLCISQESLITPPQSGFGTNVLKIIHIFQLWLSICFVKLPLPSAECKTTYNLAKPLLFCPSRYVIASRKEEQY